MKTMRIDGVDYVEAPAKHRGACVGCAFHESPGHCRAANYKLAEEIFGESCEDKLNIVYVEVKEVK